MQSILVVSKSKIKREEYVKNLCNKLSISAFDITKIESETTIGIEDVRNIQKNLLLKPATGKSKAIIFNNADSLTLQAQNSLLKILEEPPDHTVIILQVSSKQQTLPTILSRCKIFELKNKPSEISDNELTQYLDILLSLLSYNIGLRLKLAQDISKTKDASFAWIETMILVIRIKMFELISENPSSPLLSQYLNILLSLSKAYKILSSTNTNPRFTLEHFLLNLSY
ncbi:MAG: hypothetical protein A3F31_01575 [Candidatus Levybacteria bacterium RIFCSPHIGHO2_12_FULL_38_12]|nr:MAG: hypothetical protein A2770_01185 [Candidatus Levybacteria bacterium RIFCSPHIGHO2_01_FULL_38_12]OGH22899.1 MAG: hypothetical protein A3F31_01575 [Candidatus Levybacteria bacterium RIFCSPHIGHO2_12_FULL_38_12]OGH34015.1 MAG: hypothetical protein A3A47_04815 [Candidatus Levybacteria bacterium RIFCSPLOWO2_01_FULL_37_20]OGH44823.1 MAG: hypothetical protein A3J14_05350 [Candidatus Levybacteria bacterium RIFCSPLOWO2_02_FULL_37_18]